MKDCNMHWILVRESVETVHYSLLYLKWRTQCTRYFSFYGKTRMLNLIMFPGTILGAWFTGLYFFWSTRFLSGQGISPSSKGDCVLLHPPCSRTSSCVVAAETLASPVFPQYIGQRDCADRSWHKTRCAVWILPENVQSRCRAWGMLWK